MGRTVPSFRIALANEESRWRVYRSYLNKKERIAFDDMFARVRNYCSCCMMAANLVPFYPIAMSILFDHYRELKDMEKTLGERKKSSLTTHETNPKPVDCGTLDQFVEPE